MRRTAAGDGGGRKQEIGGRRRGDDGAVFSGGVWSGFLDRAWTGLVQGTGRAGSKMYPDEKEINLIVWLL
jgi:hypothetical protein